MLRKLTIEAKVEIRIEEESKPFDPMCFKSSQLFLKGTYVFMKLDCEKKGVAINGKVCESLHFIGRSLHILCCIWTKVQCREDQVYKKKVLNMKSM